MKRHQLDIKGTTIGSSSSSWRWLGLLLLITAGCTSQPPEVKTEARPFEGVPLTLLVVDDPALAAEVSKLQGEWKAQSGATLEVAECSEQDLLSKNALSADAVIYPSRHLGELVERELIEPLSPELLDDSRLAWSEVFEALRLYEVTRDGRAFALPFGSPLLVCYYRGDLFEQFDKQPPRTWRQFAELVEYFADREHAGFEEAHSDAEWSAVRAPQGEYGQALLLLAWAASYAKHPDYFSTLFDLETMAPRIDSPPFVRALEERVAAKDHIQPAGTPAEVAAAFWRGECAMALTWASAAEAPVWKEGAAAASERIEAKFCELPGAEDVFNPGSGTWEERPDVRTVPLLGVSGRIGSVVKASQHQRAAAQLLATLSGPQWSTLVSSASPATTLFRERHLESPRDWTEPPMDQVSARRYADLVQDLLSRQEYLSPLPIPGGPQYLAALDEAVGKALAGDQPAEEALKQCAARWEEITEQLGRQRQREAYRQSVEFGP